MEEQDNAKEVKLKIKKNSDGKLIGLEGLGAVPESLQGAMALTPFVDSIRETVETLNRDMAKATDNLQASIKLLDINATNSSKKVERLTIFLSWLTAGLLVETGVLIFLTYLLIR